MPGSRPATAPKPRTLADAFRRFGKTGAARVSPLYERVALAVGASDAALRAVEEAPARRRQPALVLAALHHLALTGQAPELAAAYTAGDPDAAAVAAVAALPRLAGQVAAIAGRRRVRAEETGRHTVLLPLVAEAAHRLGAPRIALIDVGCSAGLNLNAVHATVAYGNGQTLGDASSPVRQSAGVVGDRPLPVRNLPRVAARFGLDHDPIDVTDAEEAGWLRACLPPDRHEAAALLDAEIALTEQNPPLLVRGDPLETLPEAFAAVPADALPVVTTAWALARLPPESRLRFLHRLDEAAARRPVAWVSAEGVGVAPSVPTFGDRHASGHSILGIALYDGPATTVEAVGRCWSRGRLLAWLADTGA
ncbi:DUF2332 domain-containing protein [Streptomyces sp. NPDC047130]|uniref:DUF2332 domain-containing protein n=1 Tax=Streptomyces sp. NPDC047130 TaxID=3155261 RepID=UPI0033C25FC6